MAGGDDSRRSAWPTRLWLVRHGESAGNVAWAQADRAQQPTIDVDPRDVDVPLSNIGERQAAALGRWFGAMAPPERPTVVLSSPYRRALGTAEIVAGALGLDRERGGFAVDERLREKELGALARLTRYGIRERFPAEVERRREVGKFYYRPPGGESWCDVLLRLRAVIDTVAHDYAGERVLIVSHQVIVTCARYILERLDETQLLAIDRERPVPNCSVTAYDIPDGHRRCRPLQPSLVYFVTPMVDEGEPVTAERDASPNVE